MISIERGGDIEDFRGPGVTEEIDWSVLSDDEEEEEEEEEGEGPAAEGGEARAEEGEEWKEDEEDEEEGEEGFDGEEGANEQFQYVLALPDPLDAGALEAGHQHQAHQSPVPLPAGEVGSPLDAAAARSVRRQELRRRRAMLLSSPHLFLRRAGPRRSRESAAAAAAGGVRGVVVEGGMEEGLGVTAGTAAAVDAAGRGD